MKKYIWYRYTFTDGHDIISRGFSKNELMWLEKEHGKLLRKTREGKY